MVTVATVVEYLDQFAPAKLAEDWDNVGLLLGDRDSPVQRVMTCLTVTPASASEAVAAGVQLVVTHHPILFRPIKRLTTATPEGRMLLSLLRAGVAVYSPHTSFDNTAGGINDMLAQRLELIETSALRRQPAAQQFKIVVFVPEADLGRVSEAMFAAGAGHIGQYSQCSFRLAGTGTFFGSDAANPTVGQKGRREEVGEWRLEVICPEAQLQQVLQALRRAHSYEEPAFDVYPLWAAPPLTLPSPPLGGDSGRVRGGGAGRTGRLPTSMPLAELARRVQIILKAGAVQVVGDPNRLVERLAVVCGAGGDFLADAVRAKGDALLTGEMRFHDYLAAQAQGLALVLPGHYATERFGIEELAVRLQAQWPGLKVWVAQSERDPVSWVSQ